MHQHVRSCQKCQIRNLQKPYYMNLYQDIVKTPQDYIYSDPLGPYNTDKATPMSSLQYVALQVTLC